MWLHSIPHGPNLVLVVRNGLCKPPVVTVTVQYPDRLILDKRELVSVLGLNLSGRYIGN